MEDFQKSDLINLLEQKTEKSYNKTKTGVGHTILKEGQKRGEVAKQSGQGGNRYSTNIKDTNISKPKTLSDIGLTAHNFLINAYKRRFKPFQVLMTIYTP